MHVLPRAHTPRARAHRQSKPLLCALQRSFGRARGPIFGLVAFAIGLFALPVLQEDLSGVRGGGGGGGEMRLVGGLGGE